MTTIAKTTQALLALVETERERRVAEIVDAARAQAAATVARAHADARARTRTAYGEARERHEQRVAAAHADLATRRRLAEQRHVAALLAEGMKELPPELARRWSAPQSRRAWVECVVAAARASLPRGEWRIAHPADWLVGEREAVGAALATLLGVSAASFAMPSISGGLAISAAGSVVDGTLEGLLADRADVESKLLFELQEAGR